MVFYVGEHHRRQNIKLFAQELLQVLLFGRTVALDAVFYQLQVRILLE